MDDEQAEDRGPPGAPVTEHTRTTRSSSVAAVPTGVEGEAAGPATADSQQAGLSAPQDLSSNGGSASRLALPDEELLPHQRAIIARGRRRGRCKFFNVQKGFGFILDDQSHELTVGEGNGARGEVFVHFSSIVEVRKGTNGFKSLREAEEVEYDPKRSRKGWLADNVTGPRGAPCEGALPRSQGRPASQGAPGVSTRPVTRGTASRSSSRGGHRPVTAFHQPYPSAPPENMLHYAAWPQMFGPPPQFMYAPQLEQSTDLARPDTSGGHIPAYSHQPHSAMSGIGTHAYYPHFSQAGMDPAFNQPHGVDYPLPAPPPGPHHEAGHAPAAGLVAPDQYPGSYQYAHLPPSERTFTRPPGDHSAALESSMAALSVHGAAVSAPPALSAYDADIRSAAHTPPLPLVQHSAPLQLPSLSRHTGALSTRTPRHSSQ